MYFGLQVLRKKRLPPDTVQSNTGLLTSFLAQRGHRSCWADSAARRLRVQAVGALAMRLIHQIGVQVLEPQ